MKVKIQYWKEVKTSRDSMGSFGEFDVIGGSRKTAEYFYIFKILKNICILKVFEK